MGTQNSYIGVVNKANNGQMMEIVKYINYLNLVVRFEDGTIVENVRNANFKSGKVRNPNFNGKIEKQKKERLGQVVVATNNQKMEIVDYTSASNVVVKFEDGTLVHNCSYTAFKKGGIANPNFNIVSESNKSLIGLIGYSNAGQKMKILDVRCKEDIDVVFENGGLAKGVSYYAFKSGCVRNPMELVGMIGKDKDGCKIKIVSQIKRSCLDVEYEDGFVKKGVTFRSFKDGLISRGLSYSRVGEKAYNRKGEEMVIVHYSSYLNIDVRFTTGEVVRGVSYSNFKKGEVLRNRLREEEVEKENRIKSLRIGEVSYTSEGQKMEIVSYKGIYDIDVVFEDGILVKNKRYSDFKSGKIKNPSNRNLGSKRVGERGFSDTGLSVELIKYNGCGDIVVRFKDGVEVGTTYSDFKLGKVKRPEDKERSKKSERLGLKGHAKNGSIITIVEYSDSSDIVVQFEDGRKVKTTYPIFKKGNLVGDLSKMRCNEKIRSNGGIDMEIIRYTSAVDITVQFEDLVVVEGIYYSHFKEGTVRRIKKNSRIYNFVVDRLAYRGYNEDVFYVCQCIKCGYRDILTPQEMGKHKCTIK